MTLSRLNELRKGLNELKALEKEINIKTDSIGGNISGMPCGKSCTNGTEIKYISALKEKEQIERRYKQMEKDYSDCIDYINSIKEHTLHLIFYRRFIQGYSWTKVAVKTGGNNTADNVRMRVIRYLKAN